MLPKNAIFLTFGQSKIKIYNHSVFCNGLLKNNNDCISL